MLIAISFICFIFISYGVYTDNLLSTCGSFLVYVFTIILYGLSQNGVQFCKDGKIFSEKVTVSNSLYRKDNSLAEFTTSIIEDRNPGLNASISNLMEISNDIKFTIRKVLELFRDIFNADACYLYLINTEMDPYEKMEILNERIDEMKEAYNKEKGKAKDDKEPFNDETNLIRPNQLSCNLEDIKILKFIDVSQKEKIDGSDYWNYSYRNSPRKYVIFTKYDNGKEISKKNTIFNEGITAYIARTKETVIFKSRKEINAFESSAYLNTRFDIKPISNMLIGFPLIDENGNSTGVLTVEDYNTEEKYDEVKKSKEIQEAERYLSFLIRLIKSSRTHFINNSYEQLFGCMNLLENLKRLEKKIEPSEKVNYKIYRDTMHLFFVLKEREYIGYEEILDRVTGYTNDIDGYLELAEEGNFFNESLDQIRKHKKLLLDGLTDFRDFFMHKFHVFVSGYIIINELGIDNFRSKVQKHMRCTLGQKGQNLVISEDDVLKIWFLTAFYHDYACILKKMDKELEVFYNDVFGNSFGIKSNLDQLLRKERDFTIYLSYLIKFFSSPKGTNSDVLLRNYLDAIIKSHDPGILSALLLIHNYNSKVGHEIRDVCLYAAFSISIHTKKIYENLTEGNMTGISFESFPIAFLLSFCDTAQSFERIGKRQDYHVRFSDIKFSDNRIIYELECLVENGKKIPSPDTIEVWANKAHNAFKSSEYFFDIEYYEVKEKEEKSAPYRRPIYTLSYGYYKDTPKEETKRQDDQINYT